MVLAERRSQVGVVAFDRHRRASGRCRRLELRAVLEVVAVPQIADSAETCDVTLDWLFASANTLYLCAPLGDETRVGIVFACCSTTSSLRRSTGTTAQGSPSTRASCSSSTKPPTPCSQALAVGCHRDRRRMQFVTVWQSKGQLDETYGRDADNLLTNHQTDLPERDQRHRRHRVPQHAGRHRAHPQRPRRAPLERRLQGAAAVTIHGRAPPRSKRPAPDQGRRCAPHSRAVPPPGYEDDSGSASDHGAAPTPKLRSELEAVPDRDDTALAHPTLFACAG